MDSPEYSLIHRLLYEKCRQTINGFVNSPDNRGVYAFCIYCFPEDGGYTLCLNTESAFRSTAEKRYPGYTASQLSEFLGPRFNPADFTFFDMGLGPGALDAACALYRDYMHALGDRDEWDLMSAHASQFVEHAVLVIQQLDEGVACILASMEQGRTFVSYTPRFPTRSGDPNYRFIKSCRKQFLHYLLLCTRSDHGADEPAGCDVLSFQRDLLSQWAFLHRAGVDPHGGALPEGGQRVLGRGGPSGAAGRGGPAQPGTAARALQHP